MCSIQYENLHNFNLQQVHFGSATTHNESSKILKKFHLANREVRLSNDTPMTKLTLGQERIAIASPTPHGT
jgi:hypothetical protein